jgi:very-short-patch-repair endonuclease
MTDAEWKLWMQIRDNQLGVKFLRQRPIGSYIGDFVSIDAGLIVEIDGSQHLQNDGPKYDKERDEYLRSLGFQVLRFSNVDVLKNIAGVVAAIREEI